MNNLDINKSIITPLLTMIFMLSACGGGGGSSSSSNNTSGTGNTNSTENTGGTNTTAGGTLANPTTLEANKKYSLVTNTFYNYFTYSGNDQDILFLKANYDLPFNIKQRTRCAANWRDYPTTFKVYDNTGSAITGECTEAFTFRFDKPEQIVVQLPLSDQGNGELFTAVVNRNSAIVNPTGTSRSPSNPATISSTNQLNQNSFYNYFKYSGKAGEVIHISILLDAPLTTTQKARCSAAGGYSYSTGFRIYNDSYNSLIGVCGTELTYRFNSDDTYIFNFNFEGAGNENGGGIGTGTIYFESLGVRE